MGRCECRCLSPARNLLSTIFSRITSSRQHLCRDRMGSLTFATVVSWVCQRRKWCSMFLTGQHFSLTSSWSSAMHRDNWGCHVCVMRMIMVYVDPEDYISSLGHHYRCMWCYL